LPGSGYATEIPQAVVDYAFDVLEMPIVTASTDPPNVASVRVLEKAWLQRRPPQHPGGLDTVFFELKRT
jgi:RimJ/RimL family protein N-acetyltransferase